MKLRLVAWDLSIDKLKTALCLRIVFMCKPCIPYSFGVAGLGSNVGSPTNGAMGGYGQGNLAGAAGGMPAMGSASNGMGGVSQHGQQGGGMDTLSQAYSGIQQYAGLSGLLSQGKCSLCVASALCYVFLRLSVCLSVRLSVCST